LILESPGDAVNSIWRGVFRERSLDLTAGRGRCHTLRAPVEGGGDTVRGAESSGLGILSTSIHCVLSQGHFDVTIVSPALERLLE